MQFGLVEVAVYVYCIHRVNWVLLGRVVLPVASEEAEACLEPQEASNAWLLSQPS